MDRTRTKSPAPAGSSHKGAGGPPTNEMPGQRALGAMAEAARRAREATSRNPAVPMTAEVPRSGSTPPGGSPNQTSRGLPRVWPDWRATRAHRPPPEKEVRAPSRRREYRLVAAVLVAAALVLVTGTALAVMARTHQTVITRAGSGVPAASGHVTATKPTVTHRAASRRRGAAPTRSRPGAAVAGSSPVLSALSPSTGGAGQAVAVSGANFMSADGQIVARFGGQVTSTDCPSQTSCTVTVPALSGAPRSVMVTITTEGGTSNTLAFAFS